MKSLISAVLSISICVSLLTVSVGAQIASLPELPGAPSANASEGETPALPGDNAETTVVDTEGGGEEANNVALPEAAGQQADDTNFSLPVTGGDDLPITGGRIAVNTVAIGAALLVGGIAARRGAKKD